MLPSPTLSDCDSLAGIEDLDAYLSAQGPLSIFSTPGLRSDEKQRPWQPRHQAVNLQTPPTTPPDDTSDAHAATELAETNAARYATAFAMTFYPQAVQQQGYRLTRVFASIFSQLQLQPEVIAVAFAIAQASVSRAALLHPLRLVPEAQLLSCLVLADMYTNDHPRSLSRWLSLLAAHTTAAVHPSMSIESTTPDIVTVQQLNETIMTTLKGLDWKIHSFCCPVAIDTSMAQLRNSTTARSKLPEGKEATPSIEITTSIEACLVTDTMHCSSIDTACIAVKTPPATRFLPLL